MERFLERFVTEKRQRSNFDTKIVTEEGSGNKTIKIRRCVKQEANTSIDFSVYVCNYSTNVA